MKGKFMVVGQRGGRYWIRRRDILDKESAVAYAESFARVDKGSVKMSYHAVEILHTAQSSAPQALRRQNGRYAKRTDEIPGASK